MNNGSNGRRQIKPTPFFGKLKRFLLSKKTVLGLFGLLTAAIIIGSLFPQRFRTSPLAMAEWQSANQFLGRLMTALAFDHVYTSHWFAGILGLFLISLLLSTIEQFKLSRKKTFGSPRQISGGKTTIHCSLEKFFSALKARGYWQIWHKNNSWRLVKYPWGYWGNTLFHLGMVVVIIASLFISLTQKRGVVNLAEGEVFPPGGEWLVEERGLFAGNFFLPEAVRLESVRPEFWNTDDIKQETSVVSFLGSEKQNTSYELKINTTVYHSGIRVDQSRAFGRTFLVLLTGEEGEKNPIRLDIEQPQRRDRPSYDTFEFERIPFLIKAKYYADIDKQKIDSDNPLLTLRLLQFGKVIEELSLVNGQSGRIGPYEATLVGTTRWAGLVFTDIKGINLLFFGFFIIIFGGILTYFMPPREVQLKQTAEIWTFKWRASRFTDFYERELHDIIQEAGGSGS